MSMPAHRYRPETELVHAGGMRSPFGETSEALFLTQGFVYDSAEQCEARFKGEEPGFLYSRFSNPTVAMFERRMATFEGAESARATATGMAAVTTALVGQLKAGDHARKHIEPSGRTLRICDCLDVVRQRKRFDKRHDVDAARLQHGALGQADFVQFPPFYSLRHSRAWAGQEAGAHAISDIAEAQIKASGLNLTA